MDRIRLVLMLLALGGLGLLPSCRSGRSPCCPTPCGPPTSSKLVLTPVAIHQTEAEEPSGLTLDPQGRGLWTVEDGTGYIVLLDFQGRIQTLRPSGPHQRVLNTTPLGDLEGIHYDRATDSLWVVAEGAPTSEVIQVDMTGTVVQRLAVNTAGGRNDGLEGIARADDGAFLLVEEFNDAVAYRLSLAGDVTTVGGLGAGSDLSGLAWDPHRQMWWVLSQESKLVFLWRSRGGVQQVLPLPIPKAEGVALSADGRTLYVVDDGSHKLHVFRISRR